MVEVGGNWGHSLNHILFREGGYSAVSRHLIQLGLQFSLALG